MCFTFLLVKPSLPALIVQPFPQLSQPRTPIPYLCPPCLAGEMLLLGSEVQDPQGALMRFFRFVVVVLGNG